MDMFNDELHVSILSTNFLPKGAARRSSFKKWVARSRFILFCFISKILLLYFLFC